MEVSLMSLNIDLQEKILGHIFQSRLNQNSSFDIIDVPTARFCAENFARVSATCKGLRFAMEHQRVSQLEPILAVAKAFREFSIQYSEEDQHEGSEIHMRTISDQQRTLRTIAIKTNSDQQIEFAITLLMMNAMKGSSGNSTCRQVETSKFAIHHLGYLIASRKMLFTESKIKDRMLACLNRIGEMSATESGGFARGALSTYQACLRDGAPLGI